ncbi:MAG: PocR ligand-binding domain-containing protein [Lachnospiraceae bacterium]|nr:PocR ligand-binding domain-containing protein [Lachnospiraceae bacterium]
MEPYIYSFIEKSKLSELLESLHCCIELPVQLLDEDGTILEYYGSKSTYCQHFISHLSSRDTCKEIHTTAGKRAMNLGTSYIFSCHSNLSHIVFPLINHEVLFGSILIGPFLMEQADSTLVLDIGKRYPDFTMEDLMELYDDTAEIPQVEPSKVTQISRLLYYLMSNLINDTGEQFIINQKKLHQQAKISESIQMYKTLSVTNTEPYPLDIEKILLSKVKEGNLKEASSVLNDLLGYVFLSSGNDLPTVRYRSIELCSLLSRAAIENGAASSRVFTLNNQFMQNVDDCRSTDELCYAMVEVLTAFMECMFPPAVENNRVIREAMNYIAANFSSSLTLEEVAKHVHLNPSYFSRLFKQSLGASFKEYLTQIRIEEAKRLLDHTEYSILDIAIAVGFDNQSYFTSVFKKKTGLTPGQYRK